MKKQTGVIKKVKFGLGGKDKTMLGIYFEFFLDNGWLVRWEKECFWDSEMIECSKNADWSEEDRDHEYSKIMREVSMLLSQAKVKSINKLKGIPVEIQSSNQNEILGWRIMTELI